MKLDEKTIEELIEQVLQEKTVNLDTDMKNVRDDFGLNPLPKGKKAKAYRDADTWAGVAGKFNAPPPSQNSIKRKEDSLLNVFKGLASLDGQTTSISDDDFSNLRTLDTTSAANKKINKLAKFLLIKSRKKEEFADWADAFNPETDKTIQDPTTMGNIKDIDIDKQAASPDSIAFGQMANVGFQRNIGPDAAQPMGQFQEGIASSIKTFFEGKNTFAERVNYVSAFSKAVFDTEDVASLNLTKEKFLSAALFADYLTTIVKEMDSGTAAYQFEALLAAMAGGNVAGKGDVDSEGNVVAGQMGAVDFMMNDGTFGSSKYYANVGAGNITQSLTGFQNKAGKSTLYIIAHKKETRDGKTTTGSADPDSITALNIYLVSVMSKRDMVVKGSDLTIQVNGLDATDAELTSGGKLNLSKQLSSASPIEIVLVSDSGEKLRDALKNVAEKDEENLKEAYQQFQTLFKELYTANQKAQRYAVTGDSTSGDAALSSIVNADNALIDLVAEISGKDETDKNVLKGKKIAGDRKDLKLVSTTESKFESLDQLISEAMRDIRKKRK